MASLGLTGVVTTAAESAGITRQAAYLWRDQHPDFAEEWDEKLEEAADRMEREALRRATEGVVEPVFQRGEQVGTITRYSDTLLIFLLKGARPQKYKDVVRNELTGANGAPLPVIREVVVERPPREET